MKIPMKSAALYKCKVTAEKTAMPGRNNSYDGIAVKLLYFIHKPACTVRVQPVVDLFYVITFPV
jgi:hypothetical protein